MAEDGESSGQEKTEEPTQRRMQEALKRGQVAFSREVTNFFMMLVLLFNILWFIPYIMDRALRLFSHFIQAPHLISVDNENMYNLSWTLVGDFLSLIMLPLMATIVVTILSSFMQNGFVVSGEPLVPKLSKVSPLKGLKRMFSMRSIVEFLKGIIKITIVGVVSYVAVSPYFVNIDNIPSYSIAAILLFLESLAFKMALGAAIVMAFIAIIDFMYQRFEYIKSLRMTRQELKEEFKQTEGDPMIKARLKQLRVDRARQRMMASVPKADVVITNPEHFAIALQYDEANMPAPVVLAKGQDNVALTIRQLAKEHEIPIVENPPLARALYASVELDQEIPLEFYQAVAEVIGYVYRLKGKSAKAAAS